MKTLLLTLSFLPLLHAGALPIPKGDRLFSMDLAAVPGGQYDSLFNATRNLGMACVDFFQNWDMIESDRDSFHWAMTDIAAVYYPAYHTPINLTLVPIHTNQKTFPRDLMSRAIDDSAVIRRFNAFVDSVFAHLGTAEIRSLNIGSEMDVYLSQNNGWSAFKRFYEAARSHVKAKRPGLPMTAEATWGGITGPSRDSLRAINAQSEMIGVSYYGTEGRGVKTPAAVRTDIESVLTLYPGKNLYLYQFGYPTSPFLQSSEELQRQFVIESFNLWDAHADRIKLIDFTWSHDSDTATAYETAKFYGGQADTAFVEFLRTLGFRHADGREKSGYVELKRQLALRDFWSDSTLHSENRARVSASAVRLFRSPCKNTISLTIPGYGPAIRLTLADSQGKILARQTVPGRPRIDMKIKTLPCAIYFLKAETHGRTFHLRVPFLN